MPFSLSSWSKGIVGPGSLKLRSDMMRSASSPVMKFGSLKKLSLGRTEAGDQLFHLFRTGSVEIEIFFGDQRCLLLPVWNGISPRHEELCFSIVLA